MSESGETQIKWSTKVHKESRKRKWREKSIVRKGVRRDNGMRRQIVKVASKTREEGGVMEYQF